MLRVDPKLMNSSDQNLANIDIESIEKKLAAAPATAKHVQIELLRKLNGSDTFGRLHNFPSRQAYEEVVVSGHGSIVRDDYFAIEKLFKDNPQNLSSENLQWLRTKGQSLETTLSKAADSPNAQYFLQRLRAYLEVSRLP